MSSLRELFAFIRARRQFWLIPILAAMLVIGGLLVVTRGSALAPFIYTLFCAATMRILGISTFYRDSAEVLVIGNCFLKKENQSPLLKLDYKNRFELD
jgi:hypothetical protein